MSQTMNTHTYVECNQNSGKTCRCNNFISEIVKYFCDSSSKISFEANLPKLQYFIGIDPVGFGNTIQWRVAKSTPEIYISIFFNDMTNSYCFKICVFYAHCEPRREHVIFEANAVSGINKRNLYELLHRSYIKRISELIHQLYDVKFSIHEYNGFKIYSYLCIEFPHIFKVLSLLELTKYTIIKNLNTQFSLSSRVVSLPAILKDYISS